MGYRHGDYNYPPLAWEIRMTSSATPVLITPPQYHSPIAVQTRRVHLCPNSHNVTVHYISINYSWVRTCFTSTAVCIINL